ncbi:MAG: 3-keto-5-aminohexanoate cleavage protein, partial [bacterium]|nr:3-keto-5-aminohexanoate cleavage protein [bacterium]
MSEIEATWDFRDPYLWMRKTARSAMPPLIITAAISGGGHGKESIPALPETPEEQAEEARRAYEAGASQIHVHVRDPNDWSQCTGNPDDYGKVNGMIRELCPDVIINNSTGGGPTLTTEEQFSPLFADPAPDVATLNLGPFMSKFTMPERPSHLPHPRGPVDYDMCSGTTYGELNHYASVIAARGMRPELEIYDPGQYWVLRDLIYNENVTPPYMV